MCALVRGESLQGCTGSLGLNQSVPQQYAHWVGGYLGGHFGSVGGGQSVLSLIESALPVSVLLVVATYAFLMVGLVAGVVLAGHRRSRIISGFLHFGTLSMLSLPSFWLCLMLLYVLAVHWQIFPTGQVNDVSIPSFWSHDWFSALASSPRVVLVNLAKHVILPAMALAIIVFTAMCVDLRAGLWRGSAEGVVAPPKGAKRGRRALFLSSFRASSAGVAGDTFVLLTALIGGLVVVESVFSYGGVGRLFYESLGSQDYAAVQGLLMLGTLVILVVRVLADLASAWVLQTSPDLG